MVDYDRGFVRYCFYSFDHVAYGRLASVQLSIVYHFCSRHIVDYTSVGLTPTKSLQRKLFSAKSLTVKPEPSFLLNSLLHVHPLTFITANP